MRKEAGSAWQKDRRFDNDMACRYVTAAGEYNHMFAPLASQPDGQQSRPPSSVTAVWLCAHDLTLEGSGTD